MTIMTRHERQEINDANPSNPSSLGTLLDADRLVGTLMRPPFDPRVQLTNLVALAMILILWGGLYTISQVNGTFYNTSEADRILRTIPAGSEVAK